LRLLCKLNHIWGIKLNSWGKRFLSIDIS